LHLENPSLAPSMLAGLSLFGLLELARNEGLDVSQWRS
jgi:hypothetical protein